MTEVKATLKNELVRGTIINGYRIEREIGRGAMAIVYLATQLDLGRPVAFKVLSSELSADTDFVTRFFNEARSAAALSHPNIIQAIDAGQTADGLYYFCMEYVDGETLLDILKRDGRIPIAKALEWFGQIADALNYGWELHKFTHGDIKPENIMINRQGQAKLADFGLARVDGHDYSGKVIMLTPLYAPPELIRGERFSEECRPDIYAFGASLYHALAGTPPFPGTDAQIVVQRHLTEELEPLSHRNMLIPKDLSDFVSQMLVKDMANRLGSWKAVMDGLKRLSSQISSSKRPLAFTRPEPARGGNARAAAGPAAKPKAPAPQKKGGSWVFIVVLILLLGVLAGVLGVFMSRKGASGKDPLVYELGPDESKKPKAPPQTVKPPVVPPVIQPKATPAAPEPQVSEKPAESEKPAGKTQENDVEPGDDEMEDTQGGVKKPAQKTDEQQEDNAGKIEEKEQGAEEEDAPSDHLLAYELTDEQREFRAHAALALLWLEFSGTPTGQPNYRAVDERLKTLTAEPWFTDGQKNAAQFMRETLFANYAKLPAYLREHLAEIRQITIPVERETWSIQDFNGVSDKATATVKVTRPGVSNQVPKDWMTLHKKGALAAICQKLIENGQKQLADDSVPLAYLAVGGFAREYDRALRAYPADEQRTLWDLPLQWEKFRADQKAERAALAIWGQIAAYADGDSVEGVLAKGREMADKCKNSRTCKVFQPTIDELVKKCKGLGVADKAKALLEKAQDELSDKENATSTMFTSMMLWNAKYGSDVRASVESKNEKLLNAGFNRQEEKRVGNYWSHLMAVPFWFSDSSMNMASAIPARVLNSLARLKEDKRIDKNYKRLEEVMTTLMRLEVGDWSYARKNYKQLQWKELDGLSKNELKETGTALLASSMFARAMLLTRFEGEYDNADKLMANLLKSARSFQSATPAFALVLEYWLLMRRGEYAPAELPLPFSGKAVLRHVMQEERLMIQITKRRFAYLYLAALFETGLADEAVSFLKSIDKDKESIVSKLNITESYQKYFSEMLEIHEEGADMNDLEKKLAAVHDVNYVMEYFKAKFCASGERALDGSADERFKNAFSKWAPSARLIGGDVLFDWTLRRVAWELANGSLETADELVQWTLDLEATCLIPYYARLLALQAGLRLLVGKRSAVLDAPFIAERSTALSDRELKMFKCLADYPKISEFKVKGTTRQQEYLWYQWMVACGQFAGAGKESSEFDALQKRRSELTMSERTLLTGLKKHVEER